MVADKSRWMAGLEARDGDLCIALTKVGVPGSFIEFPLSCVPMNPSNYF